MHNVSSTYKSRSCTSNPFIASWLSSPIISFQSHHLGDSFLLDFKPLGIYHLSSEYLTQITLDIFSYTFWDPA